MPYNVYRGIGSPEAIDWVTPVEVCAAGDAELTITGAGHVADTVYYYGVKAESDAGVESEDETRICRVVIDSEGDLAGQPPAAMVFCILTAGAAGTVTASWRYDQTPGPYGIAATIEAAIVTDDVADWESPIGSWTVVGSARRDAADLTGTYDDGRLLTVAIRAKTAAGTAGPETRASCLIDATAPVAVEYIAAEAAE